MGPKSATAKDKKYKRQLGELTAVALLLDEIDGVFEDIGSDTKMKILTEATISKLVKRVSAAIEVKSVSVMTEDIAGSDEELEEGMVKASDRGFQFLERLQEVERGPILPLSRVPRHRKHCRLHTAVWSGSRRQVQEQPIVPFLPIGLHWRIGCSVGRAHGRRGSDSGLEASCYRHGQWLIERLVA